MEAVVVLIKDVMQVLVEHVVIIRGAKVAVAEDVVAAIRVRLAAAAQQDKQKLQPARAAANEKIVQLKRVQCKANNDEKATAQYIVCKYHQRKPGTKSTPNE